MAACAARSDSAIGERPVQSRHAGEFNAKALTFGAGVTAAEPRVRSNRAVSRLRQ